MPICEVSRLDLQSYKTPTQAEALTAEGFAATPKEAYAAFTVAGIAAAPAVTAKAAFTAIVAVNSMQGEAALSSTKEAEIAPRALQVQETPLGLAYALLQLA